MSTLIPMCSAEAVAGQLRDALLLLPDLRADPDPYTPALLRGALDDGSMSALVESGGAARHPDPRRTTRRRMVAR